MRSLIWTDENGVSSGQQFEISGSSNGSYYHQISASFLDNWFGRKRPNQLSGGQMQRVAIARALINEPKILLADEPTGNLDKGNSEEIMGLLEEINKRGTTVIVVTHDVAMVERMKKRTITIRNGKVVSDEPEGRI